MPNAMPAPMAIRIAANSSALPCALRKRINPNAPPIATPAPMLPLTKVITVATIRGSKVVTRKKRLVEWIRYERIQENASPARSAAPAIRKNCAAVMVDV